MSKKDERISKQSMDVGEFNKERLLEMFPIFRTESGGVDFDRLKLVLGESVDVGKETFGMRWPGKADSIRLANMPSHGTLSPDKKESVNFDTTQNLIIEGDNLEVLKLLQKSYQGKVKMIYIDPPYNTGNDFIYKDDFADGIKNYLTQTGQIDDEGNRLSTNLETGGRFHSNWMNMMYSRLLLAQNLLAKDGVMFISIDDNELPRLRLMVEEIFGEQALINTIAVKSSESSGVKMAHVEKRLPKIKEYVLMVARDSNQLRISPVLVQKSGLELDKYLKYYGMIIEDPTKPVEKWRLTAIKDYLKSEGEPTDEESVKRFKVENASRIIYRTNNKLLAELNFESATAKVISPTGIEYVWWEGKQMLFLSDYLSETVCDLWTDLSTINLAKEMSGIDCFNNGQKPIALIERLLQLAGSTDGLFMDFFAGSGTTAHAVMAQNAKDGGNRKFILVQLPEQVDPESEVAKAGFGNIADITKERVRRAGEKIIEESDGKLKLKGEGAVDFGFRVLKLNESNIEDWDSEEASKSPKDLLDALKTTRLKKGRSEQDVVFEVLVKYGIELTSKVEEQKAGKGSIWKIGGGDLIVIVSAGLTVKDLHSIVEMAPKVVVMLDESFDPESLKTNARATFKDAKIELKTF